jgi:hypothetical protein
VSGGDDPPVAGDALKTLRWDWGDAYIIDVRGGEWTARRRDGVGGGLSAPNPDGLHKLIIEDYTFRPVPRSDGAGDSPRLASKP